MCFAFLAHLGRRDATMSSSDVLDEYLDIVGELVEEGMIGLAYKVERLGAIHARIMRILTDVVPENPSLSLISIPNGTGFGGANDRNGA